MRVLCFVALLAASYLVSPSLAVVTAVAVECTFSWSIVAANNVRSVGQGTIAGGTEVCGSGVLTGASPQLNGQSVNQCGWPSGTVTGYVTITGPTAFNGTSNITNGETGDYYMDVQCNLATGYPYAMSEQGIDFGAYFGGQQHFFKVKANQSYETNSSGDAYAPYSHVVNGYEDTLINGVGNFTLCCPNFATSNSCYGPSTTPQPVVTLSATHLPGCNNTHWSSSTASPPIWSSSSSSSRSSSSSTGSWIRGDPAFVGLRGQSYQIHGIDGTVYNIISERSMQVNSRFVFLTGPRACPVMPSTRQRSSACWMHDGSYLADIGLMTDSGDQLYVESGDAVRGFASVTFNGVEIRVGVTVPLRFSAASGLSGHITYDSSHELTVQAGVWRIELENSDSFVNLRSVMVQAKLSELTSHGLLGQTWRAKSWGGQVPAVEGKVSDYVVWEDEVWGTSFVYNQFKAEVKAANDE